MSQAFSGRLFGPGLPGAGAAATARWEFEALCVEAANGVVRASAGEVQIHAAGFNNESLRVAWRGDEGDYTLFLEDAAARAAFGAGAPARAAGNLAAARQTVRRTERRFRLGWAVLGAFLLLPFLLLGVFYLKADAIAEAIAKRVPPEIEAKIGELVVADVRARMKSLPDGPARNAVELIGKRLTEGSPYRYQWFVVDQAEVNAFAAPGGVVVVFSGLLKTAESAEELAGVLAHETAHVELRHSLKAGIKKLGLRALLSLALGDFASTLAGELMADLSELEFSRDAETEADSNGLERLVKAGLRPEGMPVFFERLMQREAGVALPKLLSTHPPSEERKRRLQTAIAALPPFEVKALEVDWARVQSGL